MTDNPITQALHLGSWASDIRASLTDPFHDGSRDADKLASMLVPALTHLIKSGDEAGLRAIHRAAVEHTNRRNARDVESERDQARYEAGLRAMREQGQRALSVSCSHCGVPSGSRCRTSGGYETELHAARRAAGREVS